MNAFFFRIYCGTIFAIILANLISAAAINYTYQARSVEETRLLMQGTVKLLLSKLQSETLEENRSFLKKISPDFDYALQIVPWYNVLFTEKESEILQAGGLVIQHDPFLKKTGIYALLPNSKGLLYLGPLKNRNYPIYAHFWVSTLVSLIIVGLVLFFWIHPIERRLKKLEKISTRLAHGDLSVRILDPKTDPIGKLESAFNYMANRIEALVRSQQELTNAVSHELRTPIARLRFELEMLSMATSHEEQEKRLFEADNDLSDLDKLIDELLTYARLGAAAPPIQFQEVAIDELLGSVCKNLGVIHGALEYQWGKTPRAPSKVMAEKRYLHRAVHNLVSNASRYAKHKVAVSFDQTPENYVITVDDDGPGIAMDEREHVFSAFTRLDNSRNRETGGYGLGLAIVRRIIRWHNGKVWVEDSPLGGARFVMSWPIQSQKSADE